MPKRWREEMWAPSAYRVVIDRLDLADGGGYFATVPDLPGCTSNGRTRTAAAHNIGDAIAACIEEAEAPGRPVPVPRARRR
jgi:antitoxin HicB